MTLLIHCYSPTERPKDQVETWSFLETVRRERPAIDVVDIACVNEGDYPRAWVDHWDHPGTIVNLEHDLVPTLEALDELIECPQELCTQGYKIYPLSTARKGEVFAQRLAANDPARYDRWIAEGDLYADFTGLGFVKIDHQARSVLMPPTEDETTWTGWDFTLSNSFYKLGKCWHVHWPAITHNHR